MPITCVQPLVVKCTRSRLDAMSFSRMTAIARSTSAIPVANSPTGCEGGSAVGGSALPGTQVKSKETGQKVPESIGKESPWST